MSQFTDYAENKIADYMRGQGITLPTNWSVIPGSAGSDGGVTEITGKGIAPATVPRSLAKWKSTQNDSLASTGTAKTTSNTDEIDFGTASATGSLTHVGLKDGSNVWVWVPVPQVDFVNADPVTIAAGGLQFKLGREQPEIDSDDAGPPGGATHYLVNKFIDLFFRGQAYSWPATLGLSLFTASPTDAGGGTEASSSGYARAALVPGLTTISSTQGNTSASSGTGGEITNLNTIEHAELSANLTAVATGVHDALTVGNLLWWRELEDPITFPAGGSPPFYPPGALSFLLA